MTQTKISESPFPGKLHGVPGALFSLALVLASLSTVFSESVIFAGISVFMLAALIFSYAREAAPVIGILLPSLFIIITTGDLSLPSIYIGFVFGFGTSAYLTIGGKIFGVLAATVSSYVAAALVLSPIEALPVLIPGALGILASPLLRRRAITETIALLSCLVLGGALIAFLAMGGDVATSGEELRVYILGLYEKLNEQATVIETRTAEMLAAYLVNLLPGTLFAVASAVCYLGISLCTALFRSSTHIEVPETMTNVSLSPVSGVVYVLSFLLSTAFSLEGGQYEMAAAVTDNLLVALSLPFFLMGCMSLRGFLAVLSPVSAPRSGKIAFAAIAIFFFVSSSVAVTVFTTLGVLRSLSPLTRAILAKFLRRNDEDR